jgi:hypothetical protein
LLGLISRMNLQKIISVGLSDKLSNIAEDLSKLNLNSQKIGKDGLKPLEDSVVDQEGIFNLLEKVMLKRRELLLNTVQKVVNVDGRSLTPPPLTISQDMTPPPLIRVKSIHSVSPPEKDKHLKQTPRILRVHVRNRGVRTVLKNKKFPYKEMVRKQAHHIGLIKPERMPKSGIGIESGVLIGKDLFLTTRHGVRGEKMKVKFTDFSGTNDKFHTYNGVVLGPDSEEAKRTGIDFGKKADFALIKLEKKKNDFPKTFVSFANEQDPNPSTLIHIGCKNGSAPKISYAEKRDVPLQVAIAKKMDVFNQELLWSDRSTVGIVREVKPEGKNFVLEVESKGEIHILKVSKDRVVKYYKNGRREVIHVCLQQPVYYGKDHIIIGHNTGGGSSGGVYLTKEGKLYALHKGAVKQELMASDIDHHFINHKAIFPFVKQESTFFDPYLDLECVYGKDTVKMMQSGKMDGMAPSLQGEHVFNAIGDLCKKLVETLKTVKEVPSIEKLEIQLKKTKELRNNDLFKSAKFGDPINANRYSEFCVQVTKAIFKVVSGDASAHTQGYYLLQKLKNDVERCCVDEVAKCAFKNKKGFNLWFSETLSSMHVSFSLLIEAAMEVNRVSNELE